MKVRAYVITTDAGSAPNYDPPCTTLAVCKPRIRQTAALGDLVLAYAGSNVNPHEPHTVIWAGVVSEKLTFAEYWNDQRFQTKKPDRSPTPDNFYRPVDGGLLQVPNRSSRPRALQPRHRRPLCPRLRSVLALRRPRSANAHRVRPADSDDRAPCRARDQLERFRLAPPRGVAQWTAAAVNAGGGEPPPQMPAA